MDNLILGTIVGASSLAGAMYFDAKLELQRDLKMIQAAMVTKQRSSPKFEVLIKRANEMFTKGARSFYTMFEEAANEVPNSIYLIYQGREWTYLEIKLIVWQRANYFLSQGIKRRGHLLAFDVKNRPRRDRYDE